VLYKLVIQKKKIEEEDDDDDDDERKKEIKRAGRILMLSSNFSLHLPPPCPYSFPLCVLQSFS